MINKQVYWIWSSMIQRCENPNNKSFFNYGARGISVCKEWRDSSKQFIQDMGERPKNYTLERIDNSKGYFKENCIWSDRNAQALNRRIFKGNKLGVRGIELRESGSYRVRIRRYNKIVLNVTVGDFFEACCIKKSFEVKLTRSL